MTNKTFINQKLMGHFAHLPPHHPISLSLGLSSSLPSSTTLLLSLLLSPLSLYHYLSLHHPLPLSIFPFHSPPSSPLFLHFVPFLFPTTTSLPLALPSFLIPLPLAIFPFHSPPSSPPTSHSLSLCHYLFHNKESTSESKEGTLNQDGELFSCNGKTFHPLLVYTQNFHFNVFVLHLHSELQEKILKERILSLGEDLNFGEISVINEVFSEIGTILLILSLSLVF